MKKSLWGTALFLTIILAAAAAQGAGPFDVRLPAAGVNLDPQALTVVGSMQSYEIQKGDNLLDIARHYGLGYLELGNIYRHWDPFIPPVGHRITVPTIWIVPARPAASIVVNTGAMRLFYYVDGGRKVYTWPIGMGVLDFKTPQGNFKVVGKKVNPAWHIPKSLQAKYGMSVMPAGPDNPLGQYKLTLSWGDYGIHGTHMPWGVGRLVSHGCTRMYPEHIKQLFPLVKVGTSVVYIYEPVMIGFKQGRIYMEVHEDFYHKIPDMLTYTLGRLENTGLITSVDLTRVAKIVEERTGVPTDITKGAGGMAAR